MGAFSCSWRPHGKSEETKKTKEKKEREKKKKEKRGGPTEVWSTDDRDAALAVELWAWGMYVQTEPAGAECVRGGPYTRGLFAWRKADGRQAEVALAWCRGLREGCTVAEAVAASWELAGEEYDALLHLEDRCFRCGGEGHKAPQCKKPDPPGGGTALQRKGAHDRAAKKRQQEIQRAAEGRAAEAKAAAAARAAQAAQAKKAAAEKAEAKAEAKAEKKRETARNKRARTRDRKKEKKREHMRAHRGTLDRREPRFKPGVQPPINKPRAGKGTAGRAGKTTAGR